MIAFRIHDCGDLITAAFTLSELETMRAVGLVDSRTVVSLPHMDESNAAGAGLKEWCRSHGVRMEWADGELERGWREVNSGYRVHREFARWVDGIAEERMIGQ